MRVGLPLINTLQQQLYTHTHNDLISRRLRSLTLSQLNFVPLISANGNTGAIVATINASDEGIAIIADRLDITAETTFYNGNTIVDNINEGSTTINGGKITTGTITASTISVTTLSSISANLGTITAGDITGVTIAIGSGNNVFKTDSSGNSWWGHVNQGSAAAKILNTGVATFSNITITGGTVAGSTVGSGVNAGVLTTGTISASVIGAGTITATKISVSTLSAISADMGTLTAGTIQGATIRTADTSSTRVELTSSDAPRIRFFSGTTLVGGIKAVGTGEWQLLSESGKQLTILSDVLLARAVSGGPTSLNVQNVSLGPSGQINSSATGDFGLNPQNGIIRTKRFLPYDCGVYAFGGAGDRYTTIYSTGGLNTAACDVADVLPVAPRYKISQEELLERATRSVSADMDLAQADAREHAKSKGRDTKDMEKFFNLLKKEKITELVDRERFSRILPGTVVLMTHEGIVPSDMYGSTRLAGVVSTKPGVELGGESEGMYVARAGLVPCLVEGSGKAGDRLISSTEGRALVVSEEHMMEQGALVGRLRYDKPGEDTQLVDIWV